MPSSSVVALETPRREEALFFTTVGHGHTRPPTSAPARRHTESVTQQRHPLLHRITYGLLPGFAPPLGKRTTMYSPRSMLPVSITTIRLYLHVLAATVWVGGQITLAGLVPGLRSLSPEAPRVVARHFNRIAWPAFVVLGVTGLWNLTAVHLRDAVERVSRHVVREAGCGRGVGGQCSSPCRCTLSRHAGGLGSRERRKRVGCTLPWSAAQRLISRIRNRHSTDRAGHPRQTTERSVTRSTSTRRRPAHRSTSQPTTFAVSETSEVDRERPCAEGDRQRGWIMNHARVDIRGNALSVVGTPV